MFWTNFLFWFVFCVMQIDMATAISGCSPAYFMLVLEVNWMGGVCVHRVFEMMPHVHKCVCMCVNAIGVQMAFPPSVFL